MEENLDKPGREQLKAWTKKQLDLAVRKLTNPGAIDSMIVEAKPAWVLPFQILIGKIRAHGQSKNFEWFICGDVPTDSLESSVAPTPREAARHFAMKWQLEAARHQDLTAQEPGGTGPESGGEDPGEQLAFKAEALYSLVDDAGLWPQDQAT
jgi:hypothetical protein